MKTKLSLIIAALVLNLTFVAVDTNAMLDNTFRFSGPFTIQNPCNGETATGNIDININVSTTVTGNGDVKVNVHHHSHGTLIGNQGNTYQVSRQGKDKFDAISTSYVIPWSGNFIGHGSTPDFTVEGDLRVFTNAQNEPIGSQGIAPFVRTCR